MCNDSGKPLQNVIRCHIYNCSKVALEASFQVDTIEVCKFFPSMMSTVRSVTKNTFIRERLPYEAI